MSMISTNSFYAHDQSFHVIPSLDMDKCENVYTCSQYCNNTNGSYNCYCDDGYILESDGYNCTGMCIMGSSFTTLELYI